MGVSPAASSGQTYTLERYGIDLTAQARAGLIPPVVGRDNEIAHMIRVLARMEKNNPVLLGEAGVGKTAAVQGLAQQIARDEVPEVLRDRRIIELNMGALVAGTTYRGDFEKRMTGIVREARENPEILLFVDELHMVIGAGAGWKNDMDASNMIKPALAKGELRLIGATTSREFSRSVEKDPALERRFSPILVRELNAETSLKVLQARRALWERHHRVTIPDPVLQDAVSLSEVQISNRKLPDKAIDLIDEACASMRARWRPSKDSDDLPTLSVDALRRILAERTGGTVVPLVSDHRGSKEQDPPNVSLIPEDIARDLHESLVGQEEAVRQLSEIVIDHRLSLKEPSVPQVLLFHGPAGVGKTEAARALARVLWPGVSDRLLVLHMDELADSTHLNRLIGVPVGYTGHEESGLLSLRLKRQPNTLVFLKDFPQAHPRVQAFFAGLFRQGAFTDARGDIISIQDALLVSSVSRDRKHGAMGFAASLDQAESSGQQRSLDRDPVLQPLLPQIPHIIAFSELSGDEVREVIRLRLRGLVRRLENQRLRLEFSEALIDHLTSRFLEHPPAERHLLLLMNREVIPRVRRAIVGRPTGQEEGITVDVQGADLTPSLPDT